jgi:hypothetical protein
LPSPHGLVPRRAAQSLGGAMGQSLVIVSESMAQQGLEARLLILGRL